MTISLEPEVIVGFMKELASKAGAIVASYFKGRFNVESKESVASGIDIVTDADRASEKFIMDRIAEKFPSHDILTEETRTEITGSKYLWIVDPLDGTVNFAHSYPQFGISIALMQDGDIIAGVIFDPVRNEMFWAYKGGGAFLNGTPIKVTENVELLKCILGTGFPYDKAESSVNNLKEFCKVTLLAQGVRRSGSAALDLAWVACGRLDGFWELKLKPWDFSAGIVIVEEAFGKVTDRHGKAMGLWAQSIVATNSLIHDKLIKILCRVV
ncbi:MAG: inositol monophosphatase family protein [Pseudomonadota bacterium]